VAGSQWTAAVGEPALVSERRDWRRWDAAGRSALLTTRAGNAAPSCGGVLVLGVESPLPSPAASGAGERLALGTAGALQGDGVRVVGRGAGEWAQIEPLVNRLFAERERELRVAGSNVERSPIVIDVVYTTARADPAAVYYFEASKRVPDNAADVDPDDPRGTLRVGVTGWLRRSGDQLLSSGTKGELHWDQLDERAPVTPRPDLTPLGVVRQGPQIVWVMKSQEGTVPWFTLYEVGGARARMLLRTRAAPCLG
jgi:hypothetical protein